MEFKEVGTFCVLVLFLLCEIRQIQSKKILCLLGVGTRTAEKWNKILLNGLSVKGHNLTVVTPSLWDSETGENIEFIHLEKTIKFLQNRSKENSANPGLLHQSTLGTIINWYDQQMTTCRGNLESKGFSEILHMATTEKRSFDLIIYDVTYGPGCLLQLAYLFNRIPIVGITSSTLSADIVSINQNSILNAALDPHILSDVGRTMNYWKRLYNTLQYGFDYVYRQWVVRTVLEGLWSHYMRDKNIIVPKTVSDLLPRFKVILANHHPSLHTLTSLPFSVVPVPGLHIKPKNSTDLTMDLSEIIENFQSDFVIIDLDLNVLGETNVETILEVIKKFSNYDFVWKVEGTVDMIRNKPNNLLFKKSLEIQDLYALPAAASKIKFVLTVPEILRIQECLFHAIPIIALVVRPEQNYLAKRIEEQGFAVNLQLNDLANLATTFEYALKNDVLRNTALQLQKSFVNQKNPPLDTATWWVENLMENPQANDHLYTPSTNSLGTFARSSLDTVFFFEVLILMCVINLILICKQTLENLKKKPKMRTKSGERKEDKTKKLKKERKNKEKLP